MRIALESVKRSIDRATDADAAWRAIESAGLTGDELEEARASWVLRWHPEGSEDYR